MNDWVLELKESEKFLTKGILCMVRSNGKKLYVKLKKHKDDFIELVPLSLQELKENGITIEESCLNYDFDVTVEESEHLPSGEELAKRFEDERKKKTTTFDQTNLEDMKKAEEIAKHAREVLEGKTSYDKQVADNVRKTISDKYIALGHSAPSLETKEDIESAIEILKSFEEKEKRITRLEDQIPEPSGSAPLSDIQRGISNELSKMQFETPIQMIRYLREKAKTDAEARTLLDALFIKGLKGENRSGESQGLTLKDLRKKQKRIGY